MKIDRELAQKQLEYLGYKPGEAYFRFFYHGSDPRKNSDSGRKLSKLDWSAIEKYQQEGRGVYVVVNGADGGHTDDDIKQCCAIFCEWDDIPIAEQFEKWSYLGFVEPTFTVYSGDKSMQPYWVFDEPIAPEQWRELQELLISVMSADKSNKNPSRVFRLAGGWHIKPDRKPAKTEIVSDCEIRYSYHDLHDRLLLLHQKVLAENLTENLTQSGGFLPLCKPQTPVSDSDKPLKYKDITVPVPMPISLECSLGKSKEFLGGVTTLRNTSMATLARDLIGVNREYTQLGQITNDDAYALFVDACRSCSPGGGWDEKEWETIWDSAVRSNPASALSHYFVDGLESCVKGEYWRNLKLANAIGSENSATLEEATGKTPVKSRALESDDKMIQDYNKLSEHFGNSIRLNLLSKRIEVNGIVISLDRTKLQLAIRHGINLKSGRDDIQDIVTELAEQNQYSPVVEYLKSLPVPENSSILDNMAEKYFGVVGKIYQTFVRKTLIGAVARAFRPGCKLDTALILQGKQGFKKSTFFKILAGEYFDDSLGAVSDKDERLKLHRAWFVEWSELESIFKRRDVSQTKAFLSSAVDAVRPPYCRDTQDFARSSVICATTNKDEFLSDETGNRRFWIIPIKKRIDIEMLKQERDAIWGAAILAFDRGEEWWLQHDEELAAESLAEEFQTSDPWQEAIVTYTEHKDWVRIGDLLLHLQVDLNRQERAHQMRIAGLLKVMGWHRNFRIIAGRRVRVWCRESDQPPELEEVDQRLIANVVQAETLNPSSLENQSQQLGQPDHLITPKKDFFIKEDTDQLGLTAETEKRKVLNGFSEKVDHVSEVQPQQNIQPAPPQNQEVDHKIEGSDEVTELLGFIRTAISEDDREFAKSIQVIISEVCSSGVVDRQVIWAMLTKSEQTALTALLNPLPMSESGIVVDLVDPIDAEKIRDIALIWWDEYFPKHIGSLITQMFGWKSVGTKYSQEIISQWLETEDELVRDRIHQLFTLKNAKQT